MIIIDGGDYITFDGIDVQTTTDAIEYGYFMRRASTTDGCKNVTIKNCVITMTKGSSPYVVGIYSSNLDAASPASSGAGITVASAGGRTENLTITGNTISNVYIGIAVRGFNHTASPWDKMDQNAVIGMAGAGNTIVNFGGYSTTACAGVHLYYQSSPNISYNVIDNLAGGGTDATAGCYGIWHQLSANVGNFVANNNAITVGQNGTGGGACIQATPAVVVDNSIVIQNNTFSFGNFISAGTYYLINCNGARANNITVSNNSTIGSIYKSATGSHTFYGYSNNGYNYTGGTQTISNNNFSNVTLTGTGIYTGIDCRSGTGNSQMNIITNNTITNIIAGGATRAIYQSNGASLSLTCHHNAISDLRGAAPVYGIFSNNGADNQIFQNNIYNLSNNTTSIGPIYGMIINGGATATIYNNFISDLRGTNSTGDFVIMGVFVNGGSNVYMYNNTIYLNATTNATTFGTAGVYARTNNLNFEMRNNIIVNTSQRAGNTGFTVAYRRFDNNLFSYSNASDNNLLYVSSDSPIGNYLYCEGSSTTPVTAKDSTMEDYQTRMFPREQASFNELPPFLNALTAPYDLHLNKMLVTKCESGGATITTPAITVDFDNDPRYPNTGYPNNPNPAYSATKPDGHVELIAGEKIIILPGTVVQSGAWFYAHISDTYCPAADAPMVSNLNDEPKTPGLSSGSFSIYPNPTTGNFTLVQKGNTIPDQVKINIFTMNGTRVMTETMIGEKFPQS